MIEITGNATQVNATLTKLRFALEPFALAGWLSQEMLPFMQERARARFAQEGDEASGKWAPLAQATQEIRQNLGYGAAHPINVRTGALWNFVQTGSVENDQDIATLAMPGNGGTGNVLDEYMTAQMGYSSGFSTTPARPVLGLGVKDASFALASLSLSIQAAMAI